MYTTKKTLLQRMQNCDEISWEEFYRIYWPLVLDIGRKLGMPQDNCADLMQEIMIDLFKGEPLLRYDPAKGKFRTYFISSTNCVMLADELIRNKDLSLVYLSGLVTPGAYLSFLNSEYLKPNTPVISRTLYETIPSKPSELKVKQL